MVQHCEKSAYDFWRVIRTIVGKSLTRRRVNAIGKRPDDLLSLVKKPLINSTVAANYCVMRCSKCSHMSEYAVLSALL